MKIACFELLGVKVSAVNLDLAAAFIRGEIRAGHKGYVCVAPVSTIVEARRDPAYRAVVNAAAMVTPDGMPVAWLGQRRCGPHVQRTYGPDVMLKVCDEGVGFGYRHFFYGSTQDVCDKLVHNLKARFPGMIVAGVIAPKYTSQAAALDPQTIDVINAARPDIIWVGLGSPKQDFWMALNRAHLQAPLLIGIGAAFDFHAGVKSQAPGWMQRTGLEWLFRLCCEPRRLWKRYLLGNTLFVGYLIQDLLRGQARDR